MAKKTLQEKLEKIKEEDVLELIEVEVDKNSFKGPFKCCDKNTIKRKRRKKCKKLVLDYEVWSCSKCKKEYLDIEQAEVLDKFWMLEILIENKQIDFERSINFDGKTHFVRFPKEITKKWTTKDKAHITILNSKQFLVEIK